VTQRFLPLELVVVGESGRSAQSGTQMKGYVLSSDDGGRMVLLSGGRVRLVPVEDVLARQLCVDSLDWCANSLQSLLSLGSSSDDTYPC
jgi:hypothetical protein